MTNNHTLTATAEAKNTVSPIAPLVSEILARPRQHNVTFIVVMELLNQLDVEDCEELLLRIVNIFKFDIDDMALILEVVTAFMEEQNS